MLLSVFVFVFQAELVFSPSLLIKAPLAISTPTNRQITTMTSEILEIGNALASVNPQPESVVVEKTKVPVPVLELTAPDLCTEETEMVSLDTTPKLV